MIWYCSCCDRNLDVLKTSWSESPQGLSALGTRGFARCSLILQSGGISFFRRLLLRLWIPCQRELLFANPKMHLVGVLLYVRITVKSSARANFSATVLKKEKISTANIGK